jgi:hypothetical protein
MKRRLLHFPSPAPKQNDRHVVRAPLAPQAPGIVRGVVIADADRLRAQGADALRIRATRFGARTARPTNFLGAFV